MPAVRYALRQTLAAPSAPDGFPSPTVTVQRVAQTEPSVSVSPLLIGERWPKVGPAVVAVVAERTHRVRSIASTYRRMV